MASQDLVGKEFEDRDVRTRGRVVRVFGVEYEWVWIEVVIHPTLPEYKWRRTRVKTDAFHKRYRPRSS